MLLVWGVIVLVVIIVGSYLLIFLRFYSHHAHDIDNQQAVFVLHHSVYLKRHLTPQAEWRLGKAAELYKHHKVNKIYCIGGYRGDTGLMESRQSKEYLVSLGVPEIDISGESYSNNTYTNLGEIHQIAQEENLDHALVLSSPFHLFRARVIAHRRKLTFLYYFDVSSYKNSLGTKVFLHEIFSEILKMVILFLPTNLYRFFVLKVWHGYRNIRYKRKHVSKKNR